MGSRLHLHSAGHAVWSVAMSFHRLSLFWRVFLVDGIVLVVAVVLLAIGPVTVSAPVRLEELAILLGGLATMLLVTLGLLRRTLRPLEALTETMRHIDPLSPGDRVVVDGRRGRRGAVARVQRRCSTGSRPSGARARGWR